MTKGRKGLLILAAVFAAPVALSYLAYYFWQPTRFANYGDLINPPVDLAATSVKDAQGRDVPLASLAGKWLLVSVDGADCAVACEKKRYAMRQSQVALGRNLDRIQRVHLIDEPAAAPPVPGALDFAAKDTTALAAIARTGNPRGYIFVVDPLGNLFMRYGTDAEIKGIVKDLERVLKASNIG